MRSSFSARRWPEDDGLQARALTVAAAIAGATIVGGVMSSNAQSDAAQQASGDQLAATREGIAQRQQQFDAVQKLLSPFVNAGTQSLSAQQDLTGLNGGGAQQAAIDALQRTPAFQSQLKLGENRILANASATGGLRGGNVQAALSLFSPQLLAQTINDQYGRLGGMTSLGQNAAAGVGNAGMQTGAGISDLLQQGGAALAGGALAQGRAQAGMYGAFGQGLGSYIGAGGSFGGFGAQPVPDVVDGGYSVGLGSAYGGSRAGL